MTDFCALGSLSDCVLFLLLLKQVCTECTHVIGFGVALFPLHQDELSYDESDDEDEHHLSMHGFVPFVFGVHSRMFQSVIQTQKGDIQDVKVPLLVQDRIKTKTWLPYH